MLYKTIDQNKERLLLLFKKFIVNSVSKLIL